MTVRVRRRRARERLHEPFMWVMLYVLKGDDLDAYWADYRDEWIAEHQRRHGPASMPDQWWREQGVLVADDRAEPIDPADWGTCPDRLAVEHGPGLVGMQPHGAEHASYCYHAAREARLDARRRDYLRSVGLLGADE